MPYDEVIFVETVTAVYKLLKDGERPCFPLIEEIAIKPIKTIYPEMLIGEIRKEIKEVVKGTEVNVGPYWQWCNFCWEYRHKFREGYWKKDDDEIYDKEQKICGELKIISPNQRDVLKLILTIDLI